ncbi:thioredoxin-dependent thiol peroxidase [Bacteroidota bacterium]
MKLSKFTKQENTMKEIKIGDPAPDFSALDQNGNLLSISQFLGKKLVLYFYPKDNTPGCTAEACDLRDNYEKFIDSGYNIIGVSADSQTSHQKFIQKYDLPFPLISDTDKKILEAYNAWGEKKMYGKVYMGILRKTFIISEEGMIENIIEKVQTKQHSKQIFEG